MLYHDTSQIETYAMKPTMVVNQSLIHLITQGVTMIYEPEVHMTQSDRGLHVTIWWRPLHRREYPRVPFVIPCDINMSDCQIATYVIHTFLRRTSVIEQSQSYKDTFMKDLL